MATLYFVIIRIEQLLYIGLDVYKATYHISLIHERPKIPRVPVEKAVLVFTFFGWTLMISSKVFNVQYYSTYTLHIIQAQYDGRAWIQLTIV